MPIETERPAPTAEPAYAGRVSADDFPDLQAAVDALGPQGGKIELSAKRYELNKPLRLAGKIVLHGVMDAKIARSSTVLAPAKNFQGEWLIETTPSTARENADLNADLGFYDLNMLGSPTVGGIRGANVDIMRIERCRLAYMRRCVELVQVTDLPRPYPSRIAPGGLFINNCVFQASDICLNLEYTTQNRIFANWFVSNCGVALRLLNSNKTWFFANEINQFNRAAIVLEDDGGGGNYLHDIILTMNWIHSMKPETKYIEIINGEKAQHLLVTDNIFSGKAGLDWPLYLRQRSNVFSGNLGAAACTENLGRVLLKAGETRVEVAHGLLAEPTHVDVTPWGPAPKWWVEPVDARTIALNFSEPLDQDLPISWSARISP